MVKDLKITEHRSKLNKKPKEKHYNTINSLRAIPCPIFYKYPIGSSTEPFTHSKSSMKSKCQNYSTIASSSPTSSSIWTPNKGGNNVKELLKTAALQGHTGLLMDPPNLVGGTPSLTRQPAPLGGPFQKLSSPKSHPTSHKENCSTWPPCFSTKPQHPLSHLLYFETNL